MDNNSDNMSISTKVSGQMSSGGTSRNFLNQRDAISEGIRAGNINVNTGHSDSLPTTLTLSAGNTETIAQHAKIMKAHEIQRKSKNLPVPTNGKEVKQRLRELGQPICLFGEGQGDRRERLRA